MQNGPPDKPSLTTKLLRHGQSLANTGEMLPHQTGDARIGLSDLGRQQARAAGQEVGAGYLSQAQLYCSPYQRTRDTMREMLRGAGLPDTNRVYEDPRLREVERSYSDEASQHEFRKVHGWFYYRHAGGESPADCFDRTSAFLESLMRSAARNGTNKFLIVTHGMTIRCFVMRFLHLTVEQFESMANPENCDIVTISPHSEIISPVFETARWAVSGLELR
ncbi:MAG: histidine phosphatase family protein [Burkholderiales bacterium]|nr:histidine phosphatase family protein [Burkholderiales bacterium]